MGLAEIIVLSAIIFTAAAVQGLTGFGLAVAATPLLVLVLPATEAVPVAVVASLLVSIPQAATSRAAINVPVARRLAVASLPGIALGTYVFLVAPSGALQLAVGVSVIAAAAFFWRPPESAAIRAAGAWPDFLVGFVSGVLKTAVSVNGPPLALRLQAIGMKPEAFRATMAAVLAVGNVVAVVAYALVGALTWQIAFTIFVALPALLAGQFVGRLSLGYFKNPGFHRVVTGLVAVSGVLCIVAGTRGVAT